MGMRVGNSSSAMAAQSSSVSGWQQRQQGMKDLLATLKAGDLVGAQKAFATVAANNPNIKSDSPLGQIGQALKNNDLAGAEKVVQSLQNDPIKNLTTTQIQTQNNQVASVLASLRGQGANIDLMV